MEFFNLTRETNFQTKLQNILSRASNFAAGIAEHDDSDHQAVIYPEKLWMVR